MKHFIDFEVGMSYIAYDLCSIDFTHKPGEYFYWMKFEEWHMARYLKPKDFR